MKIEEGIITDLKEAKTITTVHPVKNGVHSFTVKANPKASKENDDWIIMSRDGGYWSEEDNGRFSNGALYEKTFDTKEETEQYIEDKKIDGYATKHSSHWTGSMPIVYDSGKPAGNNPCKN